MKTEIMTKASRFVGKTGLLIKKHSPEILMITGIVGTVASTVMACKATTKVSEIKEEKEATINKIHECLEREDVQYTEEDSKKDLTIVYAQTGLKYVKLYAPSVALGTLSIASIVSGHHILKKRNIALAAAYTVVDKGFKEYRNRVVERFGEELDKELRYNIKAKEVEVEVTDENGNVTVEKKIMNVADKDSVSQYSPYAKFFDEYCTNWQKDPEYNLMFLRNQQNYFNDLLKTRGYVLLNEIYEAIGAATTKDGHVVGWVYNEKNPSGDNYIDFGIYENKENNRAFVNGYECSILLDFNVDGYIYDKIFD